MFYGIGFILNTLNLVPSFWGDIGIYFVISRLLSVLFGVLTILAISKLLTIRLDSNNSNDLTILTILIILIILMILMILKIVKLTLKSDFNNFKFIQLLKMLKS